MSFDDLIAKVETRLDALQAKPSSPEAIRALIERLNAKITAAQDKGYGLSEVVDIVVECGFDLKREEFEKDLARALARKQKTPPARRGKPRTARTTRTEETNTAS